MIRKTAGLVAGVYQERAIERGPGRALPVASRGSISAAAVPAAPIRTPLRAGVRLG